MAAPLQGGPIRCFPKRRLNGRSGCACIRGRNRDGRAAAFKNLVGNGIMQVCPDLNHRKFQFTSHV